MRRIIVFVAIALTVVMLLQSSFAANNYMENTGKHFLSDKHEKADRHTENVVEPIIIEAVKPTIFDFPDDVLMYSTSDLFDYFIHSSFLESRLFSFKSSPSEEFDYSWYGIFNELVSRQDFVETLELYAETVNKSSEKDSTDAKKLNLILNQNSVAELLETHAMCAPNCLSLLNSKRNNYVSNRAIGDYVGTIGNIDYYSAGYIATVNNQSVEVCTAARELTAAEMAAYNTQMSAYSGITLIFQPTSVFNCHSYAWYNYSAANPYWIMDISGYFLDTSACIPILPSQVQKNDIIVYYSSTLTPLHSGVVCDIDLSRNMTIRSKWGQAGVCEHAIETVPPDYYFDDTRVAYIYYRYHDYSYTFTGNNYHAGAKHFYEYADKCDICGKEINQAWVSRPCGGPPCSLIRDFMSYYNKSIDGNKHLEKIWQSHFQPRINIQSIAIPLN